MNLTPVAQTTEYMLINIESMIVLMAMSIHIGRHPLKSAERKLTDNMGNKWRFC